MSGQADRLTHSGLRASRKRMLATCLLNETPGNVLDYGDFTVVLVREFP